MHGREYITDTCVCRFHAFQDDHAVTGGEELATCSGSESKMKKISVTR